MDFMKLYDVQKFTGTRKQISKEDLLPSVAYIKDGKIVGTMFDGLSFDVPTNYVDAEGDRKNIDFGLAHRTKQDWQDCIDGFFQKGFNIDALNDAVGETKKALNMPDYKLAVFTGTLYPVRGVENFGEINGKKTDLMDMEDRIEAMKWYFNEVIRQFESKKYEHIEFAGFYWHWESIFNEEDYQMIPQITDYVRSLGLITIWAPYYNARGWNRWKEAKFDKATMQVNYFPGRENLPNSGTIERLAVAAKMTAEHDMGIEMELTAFKANFNLESLTGLKEYYKAGIETGFINRFHTYWINQGPETIRLLCESDNPYIRSAYDELYAFIHKKLKTEDIWIDNSQKGIIEFN